MSMAEIDDSDVYAKKLALVQTARRCFEQKLQTNAGGNLSVKLAGGAAIVIKPSGVGFNECNADNLLVYDLERNRLAGHGRPSKDLDFHCALYCERPDIGAIVHVHSPWATGFASSGREIPCLTVQSIEKIGRIPLIPLSANGGPQGPAEIAPAMADRAINAAALANHGTIGVGRTLMQAQYVAELIEETAHIAFVRDALKFLGGRPE